MLNKINQRISFPLLSRGWARFITIARGENIVERSTHNSSSLNNSLLPTIDDRQLEKRPFHVEKTEDRLKYRDAVMSHSASEDSCMSSGISLGFFPAV
ncbi:hypothetical protein NPIL_654331 [Nephila pilipes]|uniref:Uncharacterized protein n=1 Tax=Nephila pilipes TaxID=299642 RepID=A0A8X6TH67_NEPPI|nr:hypothetical protein NPIL_654331 [Nephila pilipes]